MNSNVVERMFLRSMKDSEKVNLEEVDGQALTTGNGNGTCSGHMR